MPSVIYKGHAHPYRESQIPKLSSAEELGQFVKVTCEYCRPKISRFYRPADIMRLTGDEHVLKLQRAFRCTSCSRNDYMLVEFLTLTAREIKDMVVRELVDIKTIHRPIWRDKRL